MEDQNRPRQSKARMWLKRIGIWGFLFFLIKGLIWIAIFLWGYWAIKK